jgi:tetratricopeptide (TPR) repeat protein
MNRFLRIQVIVFTLLLLFCFDSVSAQTQRDWWHTFERGKRMFRQGDYGNALLVFEDARRQRRAMYERMERDLIDLLSIQEVRRLGDSLDWVERYIRDRNYAGAAEALQELYYRIPRETFKNSVSAALAALQTLKDYPEAELWIGETYLVEGELPLALSQFQRALTMRNLMENPGYATELLYKIAAIRRVRQEYNEMERVLLSIVNSDTLWMGNASESGTQAGNVFVRQAMARTLERDGINRFITLYRYSNDESEQAHRLLGFYYYVSGRHTGAQEHLMFAFLIQNTIIIDELIRQRYDFAFTSLEALAAEMQRNRLLLEYLNKIEYYKTAYYLGASLHATGKTDAAREIWAFLSAQDSAGEWQVRSRAQRRSPYIERAVEMP